MSAADRLTDEEGRARLTRAEVDEIGGIIRWHVAAHEEQPEKGYLSLAVANVVLRVEDFLAARGVRAPGDTTADRDALAEQVGIAVWNYTPEQLAALRDINPDWQPLIGHERQIFDATVDALAARPALDTLAARVQALADDLDTFAEVTRLEGDDAEDRGYESVASETVGAEGAYREAAALLRALLAGRPDASPEGGA